MKWVILFPNSAGIPFICGMYDSPEDANSDLPAVVLRAAVMHVDTDPVIAPVMIGHDVAKGHDRTCHQHFCSGMRIDA